ncbi:MAG TPA: 3'(2'),5'-bisphosphate nucleotidase CysQ [Thermoanaerobaculia bacterium]|nr:3'(2'),5'-bisphosphate nucleotidase CysQ [Thermoanaerobaculia bacterium]
MIDRSKLLSIALRAADQAAEDILRLYDNGATASEAKGDGSPVTAADRAADRRIREILRSETSIPIATEEDCETHSVCGGPLFWLIDPLDGTKEFIKRTGEFTVNIALIENNRPVIGVVVAPAKKIAFYAAAGEGAFVRERGEVSPIRVSNRDENLRVAVSRDHLTRDDEALLEALQSCVPVPAGSSLKFCLIAKGAADLYPRFGRTMEWDTAAGQCVLEEAGGGVSTVTGDPLLYGKEGVDNPSFLAYGDSSCLAAALAAIRNRT